MATELELKLAVPSPALLEQIIFDKELAQVRQGYYRLIDMATVYYDTPNGELSKKRWTLRLRQENERLVVTVKTPGPGRARGEFEWEAASVLEAIPHLVEQGAPQELLTFAEKPLVPICAAQFTRREAELAFGDGTKCTFCGDVGMLMGGDKQEPLCEVELELKTGDFETLEAFGQELCERFGLKEEPKSKFARAAVLAVTE